MNARFQTRLSVVSAILLSAATFPLLAQTTPEQRLTEAYALEKAGKPAAAVVELHTLLDSDSLDTPDSGKAWNILGLAYKDLGDFAHSQHAYEESLHLLAGLQNNLRDYAMALDDFGALYVTTGRLDVAEKLRTQAFSLYEKINDHGGMARSSSDLAGIEFSQKKVTKGSKYLERAVKEAKLANNLDDDDRISIALMQGWQEQLGSNAAMCVVRYRQALDLTRKFHGEEHPFTGWSYLLLGTAQAETGDLTDALVEARRGIAILDRTLGHQNPRYLVAEMAYSEVLDATGSHAEAARIKATAESLLKDAYRQQCAGCTVSAAAFH